MQYTFNPKVHVDFYFMQPQPIKTMANLLGTRTHTRQMLIVLSGANIAAKMVWRYGATSCTRSSPSCSKGEGEHLTHYVVHTCNTPTHVHSSHITLVNTVYQTTSTITMQYKIHPEGLGSFITWYMLQHVFLRQQITMFAVLQCPHRPLKLSHLQSPHSQDQKFEHNGSQKAGIHVRVNWQIRYMSHSVEQRMYFVPI